MTPSPRPLSMLPFITTAIALAALCATAAAEPAAAPIATRSAEVDGVKLSYLTAGTGEAVLLVHGYAQSAHMWRPIIPSLARRFLVIAPDLPGFGDSAIPADGLDVKTAAVRLHALLRALHVEKARVVGHDIGLMVAYAYAALYPSEVSKLVVMDAFLPGIGDWEATYHDPHLWHFFFNGPTPEALVKGRERIYFDHYWNDFAADKNHSVSEADRRLYTAGYARPGRVRAGWGYFTAFPETARAFAQLARTKLTMPVLVIAGEVSGGEHLAQQLKLVAVEVTSIVLKGSGHWVLDERPAETAAALEHFL